MSSSSIRLSLSCTSCSPRARLLPKNSSRLTNWIIPLRLSLWLVSLPKVSDLGKVCLVPGMKSQLGLMSQVVGTFLPATQTPPTWLRKTTESVRIDSQMSPVKVLCWRLYSWESWSKPSPLVLKCQNSSKVVMLESLFRLETCQVSLTVPLYQLRRSACGSG